MTPRPMLANMDRGVMLTLVAN